MSPVPKKILIPVDFSAGSKAAAEQALSLARTLGASSELLHVWELPTNLPSDALIGAGPDSVGVLAAKVARQSMDDFERELKRDGFAVSATSCRHGNVAETIIEAIKSGGFDLVAMGTHGRTGLAHLLMGSVAEKVVRLSSCPVLTVPLPK